MPSYIGHLPAVRVRYFFDAKGNLGALSPEVAPFRCVGEPALRPQYARHQLGGRSTFKARSESRIQAVQLSNANRPLGIFGELQETNYQLCFCRAKICISNWLPVL